MEEFTVKRAARALPIGSQLHWYTIKAVLGQGGFGLTYLAEDTNLGRQVAIKEYLPLQFGKRENDGTAAPLSEQHSEDFAWGLDRFLSEARLLAKFEHPNIVRVYSVFEERNTAYMVMGFERGATLGEIVQKSGGAMDQAYLERILFSVMDGLEQVHHQGIIHRDIKPENLYIRDDGSPVLIDFGSAREAGAQQDTGLTVLVSDGYSPPEQYGAGQGAQGAWTDIYALAAVIYEALAGSKPCSAITRRQVASAGGEALVPLQAMGMQGYSERFLAAIDLALDDDQTRRPQSLSQWRELLGQCSQPPPNAPSAAQPKSAAALKAGAAAALVLCALASYVVLMPTKKTDSAATMPAQNTSQQVDFSTLPRPETALSVPDPYASLQRQLESLQALNRAYGKALQSDPQSPQAIDGMRYTVEQYRQLLDNPAVWANAKWANTFRTHIAQLAEAEQLEDLLELKQRALLDVDKALSNASLSASDRQLLVHQVAGMDRARRAAIGWSERRWNLPEMITQQVVSLLQQRDFRAAATQLGVGLLLAPGDARLVQLRGILDEAV